MKMKTIGDYKLITFLGKGSYGEIYLAQKGNDPQYYAAKVLDKKRMDKPSMKKYLDREINILKQLDHPNICKFYDKLNDDSNYYLIIEYCNGGNLNQCLEKYLKVKKEPFSIEIIQHFMRQIISAFCHIHSKKIIHRDIKFDNILLSFENQEDIKNLNLLAGKIKIVDFGVATKLEDNEYAFTTVGTPLTMDPLIFEKYNNAGGFDKLQGYNEKADVWSLGTIFYKLLTGQGMFKFSSMEEFKKKIFEGNYVVPINKNFSKEAVSFLNCMLQYDPDDRISVHNLAQHIFITNNPKDFTKDISKNIFQKIDIDGLKINFKNCEEIVKEFNVAKHNNLSQLKNNSLNNTNTNSINKANTYEEEGYTARGDIYGLDKDSNIRRNSVINKSINQIDDIRKNKRSLTTKATPNQIQELIHLQEEMKERERINKENEEKKKLGKIESSRIIIDTTGINEKEEAKLYIKGLLDEYKAAKEYFNNNGLIEPEKNATEKCIYIEKCLTSFEQGVQINLENLPAPITPEYIYNCPVSKRNAVFQELLNYHIQQKKELEAKFKNVILNYQKLNKIEFELIKNQVMPELESDKNRIQKYQKIIETIQDKYNNKWIPAPEIVKETGMGNYEKINFDNCVYKLIIHPTKTNYYNTNNLSIRLNMKINENKNFYGTIKIINFGDFEDDIIWNLNEMEWMNLSNYFITVDFYLDSILKAKQKIDINRIKTEQRLSINYPLSFLNQPVNAIINLDIRVIMPEGKKIMAKGFKEKINLRKNYPPFEGKSPYTNKIPKLFIKK